MARGGSGTRLQQSKQVEPRVGSERGARVVWLEQWSEAGPEGWAVRLDTPREIRRCRYLDTHVCGKQGPGPQRQGAPCTCCVARLH